MSDIIKLLPDSVANQIAAGEVIQRPASVIKELVENSIDAGARSVTIILKDAGRTLIQVIDDGCGMSCTDARMAFERHATSKITRADDLFALSTMGFRGEALASIAAIAQVDLRTMRKEDSIGTRILITGSKVDSQEPEACAPGCNMMVKNLFFNTPARRKFLKKDAIELSNVMREFERLALVNTGVDFTLISNDVTLHSLRRTSFKGRIADLFGKSIDKQIIPVETDTSIVRISGYAGLPENARKRNPLQYLMVNGRNMRHPYFHKAILQCYERLIPAGVQPNYFINLTVDPESIDVNIHPTKNEIKFENEQGIWQILNAAVRESLGRFNATPAIDFDLEDAPEIPAFSPDVRANPAVETDSSFNPFELTRRERPTENAGRMHSSLSAGARGHIGNDNSHLRDWEKLYDDFLKKRDADDNSMPLSGINEAKTEAETEESATKKSLIDELGDTEAPRNSTLQLKNSYILTPTREGLMVIDQHRAHKLILYEEYLTKIREKSIVSQTTMFPELIELSPSQNAVLNSIADTLEELGLRVAPLGGNSWSISAVPSALAGTSASELLLGVIETVTESGEEPGNVLYEKIALSMARSAALRRGRQLSETEMDRLISDLFRLPAPGLSPEGKPVFAIIRTEDIASLLDRL